MVRTPYSRLYDTSCVNRPKTATAVGHGEELPMYLIGFVAPDCSQLDRSNGSRHCVTKS